MRFVRIQKRIKWSLASLFFCLMLVMLFQQSCARKDCLSSSGNKTSEIRALQPFKKIEVYNYFKIYFKQGVENKVEIQTGEKLISNIETIVLDSVLTIKDLNACGFMKGYEEKNLIITVDTLEEINIHDGAELYTIDTLKSDGTLIIKFLSDIGTCDLAVDNKQTTLSVWYASGDFKLRGETDYLYLAINELAFGYAEELDAKSCYVVADSMGDCYVNTNGPLRVLILNTGNIYYKNNPSEIIYVEQTGTGKLIKVE